MLRIDDLNIFLTQGDTASLEITFEGDVPGEGDVVVMAVKERPGVSQELIHKEITGATTVIFTVEPEDTEQLTFGTYWWDLRIYYEDGQVTTPFHPRKFVVEPVVANEPEEENG